MNRLQARRLRLEVLETRSLLAAAPWFELADAHHRPSFVDFAEFDLAQDEWSGRRNHHQADRGTPGRRYTDRPDHDARRAGLQHEPFGRHNGRSHRGRDWQMSNHRAEQRGALDRHNGDRVSSPINARPPSQSTSEFATAPPDQTRNSHREQSSDLPNQLDATHRDPLRLDAINLDPLSQDALFQDQVRNLTPTESAGSNRIDSSTEDTSANQVVVHVVQLTPRTTLIFFDSPSEELARDVAAASADDSSVGQPASVGQRMSMNGPQTGMESESVNDFEMLSADRANQAVPNLDNSTLQFDTSPEDVNSILDLYPIGSVGHSSAVWLQNSGQMLEQHHPALDLNALDLALENLLQDTNRAQQLEELDQLLRELGPDQTELQIPEPSSTSSPARTQPSQIDESIPDGAATGRLDAGTKQSASLARLPGGMIAMQLPDDLLASRSQLLQGNTVDQASAWTARVGLYRQHEIASAGAGQAVAGHDPRNSIQTDVRDAESTSKGLLAARFRPVAIATSAAFGAILLGMRKKTSEKSADEEKLT